MATALTFEKAQGMAWADNKITDHQRDSIEVQTERIEASSRMANGRLRKYVVSDKRSVRTSWNDLPAKTTQTVDGFWGGEAMRNFYRTTPGEFNLKLNYGDGSSEIVLVVFKSFEFTVVKRSGISDLWSVSVELEEV